MTESKIEKISERINEKDKRALGNWTKWMKVRKEQCERLGKAMGTDSHCLIMNRDSKWAINHERDVIFDSQLIKEYRCRCGKTGCPLFWKTTEPGAKNLLAEVLFSPLKLTHENKKLSHLLEDGFVGYPQLILEEKGILGEKCLESSLKNWKSSQYYKKRRNELRKQIKIVENFVPKMDDLILIGKTIAKKEEIKGMCNLPSIKIEDYNIHHPEEEENIPFLTIGKLLLKGNDKKGINLAIDFTGVDVLKLRAKYFKITNRGQIAITYYWKKKDEYRNPLLPLKITKAMLTKFFFNKSDGILLPGQSFYQTFWFRSRTPGIFKEAWYLITKPALPPICFFLEGVVSKFSSKEKLKNNEINNYLEKLVNETSARDMAAMALHRVPTWQREKLSHASKFSEKEIFMHLNPFLYYHIDTIRKVKKLHSRFFEEEWNLSMDDLCDKLVERLRDEDKSFKEKVFKQFTRLLERLQKKSTTIDRSDSEWDMFKYHMTYLLLCSAIAKMEKSLNYKSWGLIPPNAPPRSEEDYEESYTDSPTEEEPWSEKRISEEQALKVTDYETEEDEAIISKMEKLVKKRFGAHVLGKTRAKNLRLRFGFGFKKEQTSKEEESQDEKKGEEGEEELEEEYVQDEIKMKSYYSTDVEEELYEEGSSAKELSRTDLILDNMMTQKGLNKKAEQICDDEEDYIAEEINFIKEEIVLQEEPEVVMNKENFSDELIKVLKTLPPTKHEKEKSNIETEEENKQSAKKNPKKPAAKLQKILAEEETMPSTHLVNIEAEILYPLEKKDQNEVLEEGEKEDEDDESEAKEDYFYDERGSDPALFLPPRVEQPPWIRKHFLLFAKTQWRQILEETIDDIVAVIESINFYKGVTLPTDIKYTDRLQQPC